jgi:hypothetical protein
MNFQYHRAETKKHTVHDDEKNKKQLPANGNGIATIFEEDYHEDSVQTPAENGYSKSNVNRKEVNAQLLIEMHMTSERRETR